MNAWLGKLPTTNLRIAVTVGLIAVFTLSWIVHRFVLARTAPIPDLQEMMVFLAVIAGVDVGAFFIKRGTYNDNPPRPDREDAKAVAPAPPSAPIAPPASALPSDVSPDPTRATPRDD